MTSGRIVEPLDVVEHIRPGLVPGAIDFAGGAFGLQRREEALHRRVVPDIAGSAHAANDAAVGHQLLELLAGVLGGFKRSSQQSLCWPIEAIGQAPLQVFSNQASFEVGS